MSDRGRFIVFEGLDGSGTTTQVARLGQRLTEAGISTESTKEPSNGPLGAMLRQAIDGRVRLDPVSMALAFAADRTDHVFNEHNGVAKLLADGHWVLCDRYVLSSLAYQPNERMDQRWLEEVNAFAIEPDMTVFLDADPSVCMDRIAARSSTDELFHDADLLTRVRENYQRVIDGGRALGELLVVDANRSIDDVTESVWAGVGAHLLQLDSQKDAAAAAAPAGAER
jgi:dTMP kinase